MLTVCFYLGLAIANAYVTREQLATVNAALTALNQIDNQCTTSSECATSARSARMWQPERLHRLFTEEL